MKVSVIIPVYNADRFIQKSIESILNQTHRNIEVIICNDCSTDLTKDILGKISDFRVTTYENKQNKGYQRTINFLFTKATGDVIAFQDADDISHPKRFEQQLAILDQENLDLIGTNFCIINEKDEIIQAKVPVLSDPKHIKDNLIHSNLFQKPSILFKTSILDKIGGYRLELLKFGIISEDYDWLLRICEAGFRMGNVNYKEPLYKYRSVSTAMTKGFNNANQFLGHEIVRFLAKERSSLGIDSLTSNNIERLTSYIKELKTPFTQDPSFFHRKKAENLMYSGLYSAAIANAWKGVKKRPSNFQNWRTLQYCIRKTLFKI
ncbi:glycosyltransferase family 2 protein [Reichenbachiella ulvae]|uniref:Glycosyltransferase n=1 Tax=Reichenbachiella ulvae TaxID=2980104 RepID=A0ABT3CZ26_9BACT|nr:glycosyltransferase [Reichenbachiella ulvae]MCV9388808.1 glycosyltransferase [Reichenbachiella ulvae]